VLYTSCATIPETRVLSLVDAETGVLYGKWQMHENEEFSIEFVHSVNQSPVIETFCISSGNIQAVSAKFFSFGAGMQTDLQNGEIMERDGDAIIIKNISRVYRQLNYIVGTVSDHVLKIKGETIGLRELCGKNAHVIIKT
jgi:hypothetical protein